MAFEIDLRNISRKQLLRASTGIFADDGEWKPDTVTVIQPGEESTVRIGPGCGLFLEETEL